MAPGCSTTTGGVVDPVRIPPRYPEGVRCACWTCRPVELSAATPGYPDNEQTDVPVFLKRMVVPSWPSPAPVRPTEIARCAKVQRGGPFAAGEVVDVVVVDDVGTLVVLCDVCDGFFCEVPELCEWEWCEWCDVCDAAWFPGPHALHKTARLPASAAAPTILLRIARTYQPDTRTAERAPLGWRTFRGEGSNLQHPAPKADVLPIELPRRQRPFNQVAARGSETCARRAALRSSEEGPTWDFRVPAHR